MDKKKLIIISASPKTRRFAREIGADLHLIKGSQREGRIDFKRSKLSSPAQCHIHTLLSLRFSNTEGWH